MHNDSKQPPLSHNFNWIKIAYKYEAKRLENLFTGYITEYKYVLKELWKAIQKIFTPPSNCY